VVATLLLPPEASAMPVPPLAAISSVVVLVMVPR
jgi:hypothetical protein